MKTYLKRDNDRTYITIEIPEDYQKDYQLIMIQKNRLKGLLDLQIRDVEQKSSFYYDISGMISLKAMYEKTGMRKEDMKEVFNSLRQVTMELQNYLLDWSHLLLEPEYIFYKNGEYAFCYLPSHMGDFREDFHELTEYFVDYSDVLDKEGINFASNLYKWTLYDTYSLVEIDRRLGEEEKGKKEEEKKTDYEIGWLELEEVEETDVVKEPLQRFSISEFLHQRKKKKWGSWSSILATKKI